MPEWNDRGVITGTRRHGESGLILEVMTRGHGRHLGYVQGGLSRKKKPSLQIGNGVEVSWKARLAEHMGHYTVEPSESRSFHLLSTPALVLTAQVAADLVRQLAERQNEPSVHDALVVLLDSSVDRKSSLNLLLRFELRILDVLGFGLDLESCAVTGEVDNLDYVSPKSGRAVSRDAAGEWACRMFRLPDFLRRGAYAENDLELARGFALTGHFLDTRIFGPKGNALPATREMALRDLPRVSDIAE